MRSLLTILGYLWAGLNTLLGVVIGLGIALGARIGVIRYPRESKGQESSPVSWQIVRGVIEIYGPAVQHVLARPWGAISGISAITFGHVVLGGTRADLDRTREHERVHVRQYTRWGPFFLPAYLLSSLIARSKGLDPYLDNVFEEEAYDHDRARLAVLTTKTAPVPQDMASANPSLVRRFFRLLLWLGVSWTVMAWTHEGGHIVGGWLMGGHLQYAELRPWLLPYSHFEPDPQPLVTLWAGPIFGAVVPWRIALMVPRVHTRFIAGFCLLANGAYLATAAYAGDALLDTTKLLAAGAWSVSIGMYCLITITVGYPMFRDSVVRLIGQPSPKADPSPPGSKLPA